MRPISEQERLPSRAHGVFARARMAKVMLILALTTALAGCWDDKRIRYRLTFAAKHSIGHYELLQALAMSAGIMIHQSVTVLPPTVGATIALEIMTGVARMPPLTSEQAAALNGNSPGLPKGNSP